MAGEKLEFITREQEFKIIEAKSVTIKKAESKDFGKTKVILTYMNYGKPVPLFIDPEIFKKFYGFTLGEDSEKDKTMFGKSIKVTSAFSPL